LGGVALAGEGEVHREGVRRLDHARQVPGARRAGGRSRSRGRPGAATDHHGDAGVQRLLYLLRADEMDVAVDAAGGEDLALAGDGLRARPDDDVDARLDVRVAGLADGGDAPVPQADVRLDDARVVDDEGVGDDRIDGSFRARYLALPHAVADDFAAAELNLFAIDGQVLLHLDDKISIGEAHLVARGGSEHVGIGGAGDLLWHQSRSPIMRCWKPNTRRLPANGTRLTSRVWPGSKRTAVPAGMSSRHPRAMLRSNCRAWLVSAKW